MAKSKTQTGEKEGKQVNCQLPGADLVAAGKSVEEAVETAERKKHAGGRPTDKTPELITDILVKLMEGQSLVKICKAEGMPCYATVCNWLAADKQFLESYVKAREVQADYIFDEALDIADDSSEDEIMTEEGRRLLNKEFVARSKLRVETRLRMAGKLAPKKYGDKIMQEVSGPDGRPMEFNDIQRSARIAALLSEARKRAGK